MINKKILIAVLLVGAAVAQAKPKGKEDKRTPAHYAFSDESAKEMAIAMVKAYHLPMKLESVSQYTAQITVNRKDLVQVEVTRTNSDGDCKWSSELNGQFEFHLKPVTPMCSN